MEFRKDINGLRAWAVVLVMLYHFGMPGLPGGFIGVDVFFVISGYLMTGIILGRQSSGRFSLVEFYLSRARRIVPALAVLCVGVLVFGWFWLGAVDYKTLGTHTESAMLFYSNHIFAGEAGYFDAESSEKWLLHTWSLSVEWQFYLLYPLLLILLTRLPRFSAKVVVLSAMLGSLLYSLFLTRSEPSQAFYLLPARGWELLAGGAVYLFGARAQSWKLPRTLLEYAGFVLIVIAAAGVDRNHWPGPLVTVPVMGTVMVLLSARQESVLTAAPFIQSLGRWSYSIYLWHWPLLVGALYLGVMQGTLLMVVLLLASVALGALSFRFIEEPFRHTGFGRRIRWRGILSLMFSVVIAAEIIVWAKGVPARLPDDLARIEQQMLIKETDVLKRMTGQTKCGWNKKSERITECRYGSADVAPTVAVWGDSHANKSILAMHQVAQRNDVGVALYYRNGCPPLQGYISRNGDNIRDCRSFNRQVLKRIVENQQLNTVVLVANWPSYLGSTKKNEDEAQIYFGIAPLLSREAQHKEFSEHMVADMCALRQFKKRVVVTTPMPYFGVNVPKHMAQTYISSGSANVPSLSRQEHMMRNGLLMGVLAEAHAMCGVEILDSLPIFCDGETCYGARQGIPLYSDDNHLSMHGNDLIQPFFEQYFRKGHE